MIVKVHYLLVHLFILIFDTNYEFYD